MISVIIPTLNEAKILDQSLSRLSPQLKDHELIIVDGGSTDETPLIAKRYGRAIAAERGRARQSNAGAAAARGAILLFLHADVWLDTGALKGVETAISAGYVGGAFKQRIEGDHPLYRLIESAANFRAKRMRIFYGDGGIFVRRTYFDQIGGFPDIPIMEEVRFSRKLCQHGEVTLVERGIHISARRWQQNGILRTTLTNWLITLLYLLRIPPNYLAKLYRHIR
jgi:rSAM/selenodomain-associated transferase 2